MKAIDKSKAVRPASLTDEQRQEAFEENAAGKHYKSDDKYKTKEVQSALNEVYNKKCAYCEKQLTDAPKNIDHYRPKIADSRRKNCDASHSYFWLAFSWDNLLLACTACNASKGSCFDIKGERAHFAGYQNKTLEELQDTISQLDAKEKPLLVNPEQEEQQFFSKNLTFDMEGNISSENERLAYTIETCRLNRKELKDKRLEAKNDLLKELRTKKFRHTTHKDNNRLRDDIEDIARKILDKIKHNKELTAWNRFLVSNLKTLEKMANTNN